MNLLAIDYGIKRFGFAVSIMGIITPIPGTKNDTHIFEYIDHIISDYKIEKIFIGISEGEVANKTKKFSKDLSAVIKLPIETVEEAVSTIEAEKIFISNRNKKKNYKKDIDSVAAAVILRRVIS